jgi:hypothetical protein
MVTTAACGFGMWQLKLVLQPGMQLGPPHSHWRFQARQHRLPTRQAVDDVARHPQVVAHLDAGARANLYAVDG